jgi:DNA primase small subunit
MREEQFLLNRFRGFYGKHSLSVPSVESREFGVGSFGKKISRRHLAFPSAAALNSFLRSSAPLFISYSVAYYERPDGTPMQRKGFLGADIVYEFDADDLKSECKQKHDRWSCPTCGGGGNGGVDNCPKCGAVVRKEQWFCPECVNETKRHVLRLLDFIENDFSLGEDVSVNFSGNAGYHVHLRGASVRSLSQDARVELLDYLTAKGLDLSKHGFGESGRMFLCPLPESARGWGRRLLESLVGLFEEGNAEKIAAFGNVSCSKVEELLAEKELVLRTMREKGILFSIAGRKNKEFWLSLLGHLVEENALAIDRQTSVDISKIIRLPNSLHGSTGLVAKTVPLGQLANFEPFDEAVVFSDESTKVFINKSPRFYLKGNWFGPFDQEEAELPLYAALYLVARGSALLVG